MGKKGVDSTATVSSVYCRVIILFYVRLFVAMNASSQMNPLL